MEQESLHYIRCPFKLSGLSGDSTPFNLFKLSGLSGDSTPFNLFKLSELLDNSTSFNFAPNHMGVSLNLSTNKFFSRLIECISEQISYRYVHILEGDGKNSFVHGIFIANNASNISDLETAIYQNTGIPIYHQHLISARPWTSALREEDLGQVLATSDDLILYFRSESIVPGLEDCLGIILVTELRCNTYVDPNVVPKSRKRQSSQTLTEIPLWISLSTSLFTMKEIVALATSTFNQSIELSFAGRALEDDQMTVGEYGIYDGSKIRMKLRDPGDMQSSTQVQSLDDVADVDQKTSDSKNSIQSFFTGHSSTSQAFFSARSRVTLKTSDSKNSIQSFFTGHSSISQAFFSARSRVTLDGPPILSAPSKFMTTIKERGLLPESNKEIDWSGRGQYVEYGPLEDVNLQLGEIVGWSSTAVVTAVTCRRIKLARKTIQCKRMKLEDALCEVAHLQNLSHPHVVQLIGTYLQDSRLSILLYPLAEWDLCKFLRIEQKDDRDRLRFLEHSTICLLSAVEYIHGHTIRHMDIKPSNILIKYFDKRLNIKHGPFYGFRVLLADFDVAYDFRYDESSKTEGNRTGTPTYRSPEAFNGQARGRSSDIFSLGCVFAEILTVCKGRNLDEFEAYRQSHDDTAYHSNLEKVYQWLAQELPPERDGFPVIEYSKKMGATTEMLSLDPEKRPAAMELLQRRNFGYSPGCVCKRLPLVREG